MDLHFSEQTLKELIQSFESLKITIQTRDSNLKITLQSPLFKLPLPLLIRRVFIFLDEDDLIKLAQTSMVLRKIIYSPIGLKIMLRASRSRVVQVLETQVETVIGQNEGIIASGGGFGFGNEKKLEGEDMIAQLETLRNLKEFLTEKIKENEINMGKLRAEIEDLKNQLRIQKQINSKSVSKIQVLENKILNEDKEKQELIRKIKENEEEIKKMQAVNEEKLKLFKTDKDQLLAHKKVLVSEVKKLREDLEKSQQNQECYVDALKKLKATFVTSDLYQKLEEMSSQHQN